MRNEVERIDFPDGSWWEIKSWLSRGDKRKIDREIQTKALGYFRELEAQGVVMAQLQSLGSREREGPPTHNPDEDDLLLEKCVIAWSYSEPINAETIASRPWLETQTVVARIRQLYFPSEEARKNS